MSTDYFDFESDHYTTGATGSSCITIKSSHPITTVAPSDATISTTCFWGSSLTQVEVFETFHGL